MYINTDIFKIETNHIVPARGKVLISEPFLCDHMFGRSVILLVDHTQDGTMGLVMNKPLPLFFLSIKAAPSAPTLFSICTRWRT